MLSIALAIYLKRKLHFGAWLHDSSLSHHNPLMVGKGNCEVWTEVRDQAGA